MMTTYVEYDEPYGEYLDAEGVAHTVCATIRILKEDAIKLRRSQEPRYTSDQDALDDFLVVHWARLVEAP